MDDKLVSKESLQKIDFLDQGIKENIDKIHKVEMKI